MHQPLDQFQQWFHTRLERSSDPHPRAVCLSTLGLDGYPNARFLALKEIDDGTLIITGPVESRKGLEIEAHGQVALTFWWADEGRQVRVQGDASRLDDNRADRYFNERPREAQLTSWACKQGQPVEAGQDLASRVAHMRERFADETIPRPTSWGGFRVLPQRVEFLEFQNSRLHRRQLFQREGSVWNTSRLQP